MKTQPIYKKPMEKVNSRTRVNVKSNLKSPSVHRTPSKIVDWRTKKHQRIWGCRECISEFRKRSSARHRFSSRTRTQEKHTRKLGHCFLLFLTSAKIRGDRHWTGNSRFVILNSDVTLLVRSRNFSRTHGKLRLWIPLIFCTPFVIRGIILDRKLQVEIMVWLSGRSWSRIINRTLIKTLLEF